MLLLPLLVHSANAGTTLTGAPDDAAPLLAAAVDRCVAEHPWWGKMKLVKYPAAEGEVQHLSASADDSVMESDVEHSSAFPTACVEAGLTEVVANNPAARAWLAGDGYLELSGEIPRDTAAMKRISVAGASEEITRRLVDRAQRCGAANSPGTRWLDVEVMVGKNGFQTPTGIVRGLRDEGVSECMARSYLMDLAADTRPSYATVIVTSAGTDGKAPTPRPAGLTFASARAYTQGATAISVELNTTPLTCDTLGQARWDTPAGEKRAELAVQEIWREDGSAQWRVVYGWFENSTYTGDQGPATVTGDATKGVTITLPPGFTVGSENKLSLGQTVTAVGCGDHPRKSVRGDAPDDTLSAAERDLSGLAFSVAGHSVPLKGGILMSHSGDDRLYFSTEGMSCYALWGEEDVTYQVDMPKKGAGDAYLGGTRIPAQVTADFTAADKAVLTLSKPVNGVMQLTASLVYDHNGYAVSLKGKADILDCRR